MFLPRYVGELSAVPCKIRKFEFASKPNVALVSGLIKIQRDRPFSQMQYAARAPFRIARDRRAVVLLLRVRVSVCFDVIL